MRGLPVNNFAPVFIPTLCRYEHFKRCVESLAKCTYADKTDLIIALDYPLNDSHWDGYRKIEAYLNDITGFACVKVIKRKENYGVFRNIFETRSEIFEKYDRLIFSEDDNEFSPNFLDYMNKGLDKFEFEPKVYAVCGYNYPIEMPPEYRYNHYFWKGFSAWGYGIWKDCYAKFSSNCNYEYLIKHLSNVKNVYRLTRYADHYLPVWLKNYKTKFISGDGILSAMLIGDDAVCVFPSVSKVRNYGHDGSGAHCGEIKGHNRYKSQDIDTDKFFDFNSEFIKEDMLVNNRLRTHFKRPLRYRIIIYLKYLSFLIQNRRSNK